jgi:SAM-dependent methyltransferase
MTEAGMSSSRSDRILVLKTCVDWCLRSFIEDFRREDAASTLSLLTNTSDGGLPFENIFRYAPGEKLTMAAISPETLAAIRAARFDRVIMLTTYKIAAMYRHVVAFASEAGLPEPEVYFRHAPDGDYNARFAAGFWTGDEEGNAWYIAAIFGRAGLEAARSPRILDLGCGRGVWARHMIDLGFKRVVGVDFAESGLIDARTLAPQMLGCRADMYRLPVPRGSFDAIFLNAPGAPRIEMSHLAEFGRACCDLLKPGGIMIQAEPSIDITGDPKGDPLEVRYLSPKILEDFFRGAGFEKVETYLTDRAAMKAEGVAALTPEKTAQNAAEALSDVRFRVTVTIARR